MVPVSWLQRNPTYKDGLAEGKENSNGLLSYPVLQAADIVIYKASKVPVGKDQAPHLELSREIVRAFNNRYGPIFPEPTAVFTDAPIVLGTDGAKKMGKSAGNTIPIFAEPDEILRLVMSMVTDPLRIKRTDPGRPEVCNVCQLHRYFGGDYLEIQDGERTARTGCVDTKQLLAERMIEFFRPMREKRAALAADEAWWRRYSRPGPTRSGRSWRPPDARCSTPWERAGRGRRSRDRALPGGVGPGAAVARRLPHHRLASTSACWRWPWSSTSWSSSRTSSSPSSWRGSWRS